MTEPEICQSIWVAVLRQAVLDARWNGDPETANGKMRAMAREHARAWLLEYTGGPWRLDVIADLAGLDPDAVADWAEKEFKE